MAEPPEATGEPRPVLEVEADPVFWVVALAGSVVEGVGAHAQVEQEMGALAEVEEDPLAMVACALDASPYQLGRKLSRRQVQALLLNHLYLREAPAGQLRVHLLGKNQQFRQLGHDSLLTVSVQRRA
jgi:hypothetical protein